MTLLLCTVILHINMHTIYIKQLKGTFISKAANEKGLYYYVDFTKEFNDKKINKKYNNIVQYVHENDCMKLKE